MTRHYRSLVLVMVGALGVLVYSINLLGDSCRPLGQKVYYDYDPSHQSYRYASVVLNVVRADRRLSIFVSARQETNGRWSSRILESQDLGVHWSVLKSKELPTPLALAGNDLAEAPSNRLVQYKYSDANGMYFRSEDAGKHWIRPQNEIDHIPFREFVRKRMGSEKWRASFSLAGVDPQNPYVLFATLRIFLSEENAKDNPAPRDLGLYRSTDGAEHWTKLSDTIEYDTPLGIDPSDPRKMFGYANSGLVRSDDGGSKWEAVPEQKELELRPLYSAEEKGFQLFGAPATLKVRQIAIDPSDSNRVYVVANKGLYRSTDSGNTWCLLNTGRDFIDSVYSIAFDSRTPAHLFVGTRFGVLYSEDRGETFRTIYPQSDNQP